MKQYFPKTVSAGRKIWLLFFVLYFGASATIIAQSKLFFKEEVILYSKLKELKTQGITQIYFHFKNKQKKESDDETNDGNSNRLKYKLVAFKLNTTGDFEKITDLFVTQNKRKYKQLSSADKPNQLGNLQLNIQDFPDPPDNSYQFVIMIPQFFSGNAEYIQYDLYFAQEITSPVKQGSNKAAIPSGKTANPCPPARSGSLP